MAFTILHLPTLFAVAAMVVGLSGLILVLSRGRGKGALPPAFWGTAMMLGAGGIFCLSLDTTYGSIAEKAGNTMILWGTGLSWAAARSFSGREPRPLPVLAGGLAWLLWATVVPQAARVVSPILAMTIGSAYTVAAALELWRGREERLQSRTPAVVLLLIHAAVYIGRALCMGLMPPADWLHDDQPVAHDIAAILMIEALFHTIAMAFLLLALMKERAERLSTVRLRELAMADELTGLGNRRAFERELVRAFRRAERDRTPLGLLMIDADHFKSFNDRYGHQAGDDCLRALASAIRAAARRPGDVGLRYGGEEFAMLLPDSDKAGATRIAQAVMANVAALRIEHALSPHGRVSVSIGVAVSGPHERLNGHSELVQAADLALYRAKIAGRNRIQSSDDAA